MTITKQPATEWDRVQFWRRSVPCPNPHCHTCVLEYAEKGKRWGVCHTCGTSWNEPLTPLEEGSLP